MQKSHRIRRSRRPARLEADYPDDVRLTTDCNLLSVRMPRDLVDWAGMRVLGDEGSILFRRPEMRVSPCCLVQRVTKRELKRTYLNAIDVQPSVVAPRRDVSARARFELDRVDKVARARKGIQARAGVGVPQSRRRVEGAPAKDHAA